MASSVSGFDNRGTYTHICVYDYTQMPSQLHTIACSRLGANSYFEAVSVEAFNAQKSGLKSIFYFDIPTLSYFLKQNLIFARFSYTQLCICAHICVYYCAKIGSHIWVYYHYEYSRYNQYKKFLFLLEGRGSRNFLFLWLLWLIIHTNVCTYIQMRAHTHNCV